MKAKTKSALLLQTLEVPEGPLAGQSLALAPFQRRVHQRRADGVNLAALSIGRDNAKAAFSPR